MKLGKCKDWKLGLLDNWEIGNLEAVKIENYKNMIVGVSGACIIEEGVFGTPCNGIT